MRLPARLAGYTVLVAVGLVALFPLLYMVSLSLQTQAETMQGTPVLWPAEPQWQNYSTIFDKAPFGQFILNSLIVAGTISLAHVLLDPLVGYAFAKFRFPFKETLFVAVLGTMMIPFFIRMIPLYVTMANLGWLDTYQGLITPFLMDAFGIFLCRQFIQPIPDDLLHAARIDGASELRVYAQVILPQLKPALAVLALFTFVHQWNEFLWPLVATSTQEMRTVPVGLTLFAQEEFILWHLTAAGAVVLFIPTAVLFLFSQRYFVRGITLTGLK
ncbi:carbohydrate ABC transporter permease [Nonomuraea sp. NPDC050310]|uniref:carbohydrate ABC transporter permease n=1 Tax=unclassified Nonomuraea TaxID=2593643 RepID=UPI0033F89A7F